MELDLRDFMKTAEARSIIGDNHVFCVGGLLFQGFRGGPMPVEEGQLTMDELKAVDDRDGTMHKVWFRVKQRLESRNDNKSIEYGKRRTVLRGERQQIRESIKHDKELGIQTSPADVDEIRRIDKRMSRLQDIGLEDDYEYALAHSVPASEIPAKPEPPKAEEAVPACAECGAAAPGKDPQKWLRGHKMGKHGKRKKTA
jgi:hypothetical protein